MVFNSVWIQIFRDLEEFFKYCLKFMVFHYYVSFLT